MPRTVTDPQKSPADIAAAAVAIAEESRRETLRADVSRWREIVRSIANGAEPDSATLRDIGTLTARLHLPPNALAAHVALLAQERSLTADAAKADAAGKEAEGRMESLGREIQETRERLVTLQTEADANILAQQLPVLLANRLADLRRQTPILFADVAELATLETSKATDEWSVIV